MIKRRELILSGLAGAVFPGAAKAFYNCDVIRYGDLQRGLEMSLWRAVGPQDREATAYALVAPWCPRCRELILAAQAGQLPMNLRLIPSMAQSQLDKQKIWDLIMHEGDEAIEAFHNRGPSTLSPADPEAFKTMIAFTDMILQSSTLWNRQVFKKDLNGTPAVILFREQEGSETGTLAEIVLGYSSQLIPIYAQHALPIISSGGPFPKEYFLDLPKTQNVKGRIVNTGPDRGIAHVLPHRESLIAQCFGLDQELRMTLGTQVAFGEEWLVMRTSDGKQLFMNPDEYQEIT